MWVTKQYAIANRQLSVGTELGKEKFYLIHELYHQAACRILTSFSRDSAV